MLNLREGMRRLGILLGVLGALAGATLGWLEFEAAWAGHRKFERLCSSAVIREVAAVVKDYREGWRDVEPEHGPWEKYREPQQPRAAHSRQKLPGGFVPDSGEGVLSVEPVVARTAGPLDRLSAADPAAEIAVTVDGIEAVRRVNADKDGVITSIQLATGEWVRREPQTLGARLALFGRLLLFLLYPAFGFLVPWGTIRTSAWVAAGFSPHQQGP